MGDWKVSVIIDLQNISIDIATSLNEYEVFKTFLCNILKQAHIYA